MRAWKIRPRTKSVPIVPEPEPWEGPEANVNLVPAWRCELPYGNVVEFAQGKTFINNQRIPKYFLDMNVPGEQYLKYAHMVLVDPQRVLKSYREAYR
jgi:hypothetical protein